MTVAELVAAFLKTLDAAVESGRSAKATRDAYEYQFKHLVRVAGSKDPKTLIPEDLNAAPYTFHFTRSCRRLFKWAHEAGHVPQFKFANFTGPPCGRRERTLTPDEFDRLMREASASLRKILWFLRRTAARPGEARGLRWRDVSLADRMIRLRHFKAKNRRRDGAQVRKIPLAPEVCRLFRWWFKARKPRPDDFVFWNNQNRPWTGQALRLAMHRAADRAGLNADGGERVVCYTIRHTVATEATRRGIRDRTLADILGHTTTRTTARYQHLADEDLVRAMDAAVSRRRPGDAA